MKLNLPFLVRANRVSTVIGRVRINVIGSSEILQWKEFRNADNLARHLIVTFELNEP